MIPLVVVRARDFGRDRLSSDRAGAIASRPRARLGKAAPAFGSASDPLQALMGGGNKAMASVKRVEKNTEPDQLAEEFLRYLLAQAEQLAKKKGCLSAGLERLVAEAIHRKVDWKEVLREFVTQRAKVESSWPPPNRRFVSVLLRLVSFS